jgi:(p)ppGpp synthase/HD superfamily hydrolase
MGRQTLFNTLIQQERIEYMLTDRYKNALGYALRVHAHQTRKGGTIPYFSHLIGVSSLVLEYEGNEDQAIAGLLHDVIEDCGIEHEPIIRKEFGCEVIKIVMDCTDSTETEKTDWKPRKQAYIASLDDKAEYSLLVSCCDKLHNARAIDRDYASQGEQIWERFNSSKSEIEWYYRCLTDKFLNRRILAAKELERVVSSVFR